MYDLRLHRDEPDKEPPAPLPFRSPDRSPDRSWRHAGEGIDSIQHVEEALRDVENKFGQLKEQAEELSGPIAFSDWHSDDDDDDPWAA